MNKSRSSHDKSREVMNKLRTSWELAEALKDLKTTSLGVGWVVYNYTDIKAISAPSWGLAGWLRLRLAKIQDIPFLAKYPVTMVMAFM